MPAPQGTEESLDLPLLMVGVMEALPQQHFTIALRPIVFEGQSNLEIAQVLSLLTVLPFCFTHYIYTYIYVYILREINFCLHFQDPRLTYPNFICRPVGKGGLLLKQLLVHI